MAVQNNKRVRNTSVNKTSNAKKNNIVNKSTGRIDTKKVFPNKKNTVEVSEISVEEALSSRVKRYQKLYNNDKNINTNSKNGQKSKEEKLFITKQQKFNFENKSIEDDMDNSFSSKKKKNKVRVKDEKVSIKVEEIPLKKALHKNDDYSTVIMLFLTVVIVFLGVFLIYHFGTFDHDKEKVVTKVKEVEVVPENIVFLGDSITYRYDLDKYFPKHNVVNSGVNGNQTKDILDDMKKRVYDYNPSKVFIMIGTNDLSEEVSEEEIVNNIKEIVTDIKKNRDKAKIYLESIYPVNNDMDDSVVNSRDNKDIKEINKKLKKYCKKAKITYIDIYNELLDSEGQLKKDFSEEGLHLNDDGYEKVTFVLKKYIEEK